MRRPLLEIDASIVANPPTASSAREPSGVMRRRRSHTAVQSANVRIRGADALVTASSSLS